MCSVSARTHDKKQKQQTQYKLGKKYTKLLESSEKQQKRLLSKSVLDSLRSNDKSRFNVAAGYDPDALLDASHDDESNYDDNYEDEEEDDDRGTIHPYGPGIDPKVLLHALTEQDETKILSFNSNNALPISRIPHPDYKGGPLSPIPGAPREVQAQIVKPRFVTLNWQEPYKNADEITSYSVLYKLSTSERLAFLTSSEKKTNPFFPENERNQPHPARSRN